ncbi:filamin-A-like [Lingula anatina]|uniref:Filamin-A-like n=1 Tax=Lingula anatina TaxID=7574 RepID=A0A2R2MQU2_LINAN|nr:filamin-A-like [Lingula anatina]|eukprot:XP_023932624.1 filamin-A-like [Lingula anatina]
MADIGEKARSAEGHAAVGGMGGHDDRWIVIQKTTFTNWVNEQLQVRELSVSDLKTDLGDGVKLGNLVEIIQSRKIGRIVKKPLNQHHYIQNVTLALNAVSEDGVKLVNIGSEDIVNGNLKLILGLIWHLILRYQIGKTKFPPKKLMLSWLQAVIPECNIRNFSSDWNDGIALSALLEYCKPGLFTNWRNLPRYEGSDEDRAYQIRLENCRNAMDVAKKEFGIPMVLRPEDLANPDLDDLSGMTYLSYFMMVDSPGYHATLRDTNKLVGSQLVNNFQSDWADGSVLCKIVTAAGGQVPGGDDDSVTLTQKGIDAAKRLGVEPVLKAEEMTDPEVEHLGVMAYAARLSELKPVAMNNDEKVTIKTDLKLACVGKPTKYKLEILSDDVNFSDVTTEVQGPSGKLPTEVTWNGMVGEGTFTPSEIGQHSIF